MSTVTIIRGDVPLEVRYLFMFILILGRSYITTTQMIPGHDPRTAEPTTSTMQSINPDLNTRYKVQGFPHNRQYPGLPPKYTWDGQKQSYCPRNLQIQISIGQVRAEEKNMAMYSLIADYTNVPQGSSITLSLQSPMEQARVSFNTR